MPASEPLFNQNEYTVLTDLDWSQRWFTGIADESYLNSNPHDNNQIIMMYFNGELVYHPWQMANLALQLLNNYRATSDTECFNLAYKHALKISEIGDRLNRGIYIRYSFSTTIHGSSNVEVAPWYSGFMQGFALSLFSRIYEMNGEARMKALADSVFTTMTFSDSSAATWTTMIDSAGYYWIEEYPFHPPEHVFNGFMVGIMGMHDYYMITHDPRCAAYIRGALTTIEHYFPGWRNPGGISFYCLQHRHTDPSYHFLHMGLLRHMTELTGDSTFSAFADSLYSDYH